MQFADKVQSFNVKPLRFEVLRRNKRRL